MSTLGLRDRAACLRVDVAPEPFEPVPHGGKASFCGVAKVAGRVPVMEEMRARVRPPDPGNIFGNATTDAFLRPADHTA